MSEREFELYLSLMSKLLRLGPQQTEAIADELRDHFDERFATLCRQGVPREQAIRQALDEFGDAAGLATDFTQLARTRRRRLIMRCTLATVAVGAAALFTIQALTPPNPLLQGPPLAQAQADPPVQTLIVPPPEPATVIDPASFVPAPLAKKLTWEFTDLPLSEMLDELSRRVEMPLLIDEVALTDLGIPTDEPLTDGLADLPAYLLLDRLTDPLELDWYVDDGLVFVTSHEKAKDHLTMRSHVVGDLREAGYEPDALIDLIQTAIGGPWETVDGLGGTLTRVGDVIFLRQSDRMHREVAALLHTLRNHARETYVTVSPVHEAIRAKLQEPISIEFADVPLSQAAAELEEKTGIGFLIDQHALSHVGIPTDEPVTFTLTDKPLETVLRYMLQPLEICAVPRLGRLLISTSEVAETTLEVVLHDVSDVCRSKEETELLLRAVINETEGPWEDIDGVGGVISVPASGIMVVRQTEAQLGEVRELLAAYRRAAELTGSLSGVAAEQERIETRHYRMHAQTARDLQKVIPKFVQPNTWWLLDGARPIADNEDEIKFDFGGTTLRHPVGEISTVAIDPKIEKLPGRAVTDKAPDEKSDADEKPPIDDQQPDVLVIPQAVLIIRHTAAVHREIERFLNQVKHANPAHAGELDLSGLSGAKPGGTGGGFHQIPDPS